MKRYALFVLIALDQLACAILGGYPDETLSSYAHRLRAQRKFFGFTARWIDWGAAAIFRQEDHCRKAYDEERRRMHLPPMLR